MKSTRGSNFIVRIPYEFGRAERVKKMDQPNHFASAGRRTLDDMKILLVEDNDINRLYAKSILKQWNCSVDIAENGLVAIEKIKNHHYDVVLMDVQMPVMDGYEATRAIRLMDSPMRDAPIVALTANATKSDIAKCLSSGMNDYLPKPFTPDNLMVPLNYPVDVPIADPDNLYLITFVQDKLTRHILQASIVPVPRKVGLTPVGVEDNPFLAEIRNIHVYPNPASKHVNFALENPLSRDYTYRIIDQRGVTILEGNLNHDLTTPQQVDLNVLWNGIYFVQFRTQGKLVTYRKVAVMNRY